MKNRLNLYRDDLTYPEWLEEYKDNITRLYNDFKSETGSGMDFQGFAIGMYIETTHASTIADRRDN